MDVVTLALSKPKIINLQKFNCKLEDGTVEHFDYATWAAVMQSMESGTPQIIVVDDIDRALRKACSGEKNIIIRSEMLGGRSDYPRM